MSVVSKPLRDYVMRLLDELAKCPTCGAPATVIITPGRLVGWNCDVCRNRAQAADGLLLAALDGLAARGAITAEQAEAAKRKLEEGGAG
jgi:hypothetical protein